jgi:3-dehydroquinate dehydratase type I
MKRPHICAVLTSSDTGVLEACAEMADLFELRIDLIGAGWRVVAAAIHKPWIATLRLIEEGGGWSQGEARRKEELVAALQAGAAMVDVDISMPGLAEFVPIIRRKAECIISYHNYNATPALGDLKAVILAELAAGADICKVATTATTFSDNLTVLRLIREFPASRLVALAMGSAGQPSRLLGPLAGGEFTYAALASGQESAPGQLPLAETYHIYRMLRA